MLPKCSPKSPQSLQNRPQDAQDTAKMASWTPTWRPQGPKTTPKGSKIFCFVMLLFQGFWAQMPKTTQLRANIAQDIAQDASTTLSRDAKTPKNIKKTLGFSRFFDVLGGWMGYLRHLGSCFGRCWLEVELSWLVSALSCDMLAARWRPRAPR